LQEATEKRSKPTGKRVNIFLTEEAIASLDKAAQSEDISRSELIERFARSLVDTSGNGSNTAQAKKPKKQEEK
jgi:metal-responsive CopG/Arc/MetJ family transcriptional regulator